MKMREEQENEQYRMKKQLQKQWVFEQLRDQQQLSTINIKGNHPRKSILMMKPKRLTEQYSSPNVHGEMEDRFFQKFSYEDSVKHERWRRAQLETINTENKNKIYMQGRHRTLSQVNSENVLQDKRIMPNKNNGFLDDLIDRNQKEAATRNQSLWQRRERNLSQLEHWSEIDRDQQSTINSHVEINPEEKSIYTNHYITSSAAKTPNIDTMNMKRKLNSIRFNNKMSTDERAINKSLILDAKTLLGINL